MLDWELSHITEEGKNAIAYVSQPLASAEQNYPHLEKEGLTIIFGVKKKITSTCMVINLLYIRISNHSLCDYFSD